MNMDAYEVVVAEDADILALRVTVWLERGWQLQGGVAMASRAGATPIFAQAMARPAPAAVSFRKMAREKAGT